MTGILRPRPFSRHASAPCPHPAALAVSLAGEFHAVDSTALHEAFERLADCVTWSPADPFEQLQQLAGLARSGAPPAADRAGEPRSLLIDTALRDGNAHPDLIAVILAETGRRLGWHTAIAGNAERLLVAHAQLEQPILLDPNDGELTATTALARPVRWRCGHEVTGHLLDRLSRGYERFGQIQEGIRAAELRCELPLDADARHRSLRRLQGVRARLN